jgi:hypothetical protein
VTIFEVLCVCAVVGYLVGLAIERRPLKWVRGIQGLDQWPEPHGRYYRRWLALPNGEGDYYDWLSRQKGNRQPWRTWAEKAHKLGV